MDPRQSKCLKTRVFPAALLGVLLLALLVFLPHQRDRREALGNLAARQSLLAARTAADLEEMLERLQDGLLRLAIRGEELRRKPHEAAERMAVLYYSIPGQVIDSLYLMDRQGNLLAEYPPNALASASFPLRLLPRTTSPGGVPTRLISSGDGPALLFSIPCPAGEVPWGELGTLISLDRLEKYFKNRSPGAADFCFLLDDSGHFLIHPDRGRIGKPLAEAASPRMQPELSRVFSAMALGEKGTALVVHPSGVVRTATGEPERKTLLAFTPVQVPGGRWSLALASPEADLAAIEESQALFLFLLSLGLLGTSVLMFPAIRFYRRNQRLAVEKFLGDGENRRLRETLKQSEQRYRHLLENAGDAIFFINPCTGTLLQLNRQAEKMLGYTAEELQNLSWGVLFPARQRRRYLRLLKRVRNAGYAEEGNLLFRCKDGKLFNGAVHARLGDLGEDQVIHGVLRDVSELKRIEQELRLKNRNLLLVNEIAHRAAGSRDLEEMLRDILARVVHTLDAVGGGIYLANETEGTLRMAAFQGAGEDTFRDLAVIPRGHGLAGRVLSNGLPRASADLQTDRRVHSQAAREDGWRGFQAVPLAANETTVGVLFIFYRTRRVLTRDEVNLLLAIGKQVGIAVEGGQLFEALQWQHRLTQASNRELERSRHQLRGNLVRLEEANRALERLDRMKSQFLALASHELRTPLTCVLSGAELASSSLADRLSPEEGRMLEAVSEGGKRLEGIVQDLLEVAQIESQSIYLAREPVDPAAVMEEIGRDFQAVFEERRLALVLSDFPSLEILGDYHHLKRTFHRLVENAAKFTPEGGQIEVRAERRSPAEIRRCERELRPFSPAFFRTLNPSGFLQITIRDSGVGIDAEEQVRIFDKFYEVGDITGHFTSQTAFGGKRVGLGLALVKGMVEAHGGMVWVESPGTGAGTTGSAFNLLLPLAPASEFAKEIGVEEATG
jgi:PAS domain S-box-containing protein